MLELEEVTTVKGLKKFVEFPNKLYKDSPYYVPTMFSDELFNLNWKKNPAFEYCEARYFVVKKDGEIVGRIGGILNKAANEKFNQKRLRMTRIDFIDDYEVSGMLFGALEQWAKELGMTEIAGPIGFCDLDKEGMLVEGFDEMSMFITIYNYPYYLDHMAHYGFQKDVDWIEFQVMAEGSDMERIDRVCARVEKKYDLHRVEIPNKRVLKPYIAKIFDLLNNAYEKLYGTVPITEKQIDMYVSQFLSMVNLDYLCIIEDQNDNIVAFGLAVPSLNRAMRKAKGKLVPFGWIPVLKALKGKKNPVLELFFVAVVEEYQNKGVNALLLNYITKNARRNGIQYAETGPELETNTAVHSLWTGYQTRQHKRRRCYLKRLA